MSPGSLPWQTLAARGYEEATEKDAFFSAGENAIFERPSEIFGFQSANRFSEGRFTD